MIQRPKGYRFAYRDTRTPQAIFMVLDVPKNSIYHLTILVVEYLYDTKLCLPHLRTILEYVARKRDVFVGRVDHRGTSQTCPNCRTEVRKDLSIRLHECHECGYVIDRDIASAQEICNRGQETYRGTPEKQEIGSQVVLSGNLVLDKWRNSALAVRGAMPNSDIGKPTLNQRLQCWEDVTCPPLSLKYTLSE